MKILVEAGLLAGGGKSGVEEYTTNLIEALVEAKPETKVLIGGSKTRNEDKERKEVVRWRIPNKILTLSRILNWPAWDWFFKAEVVISPHFINLPLKKVPRILVVHDLSWRHYPQFFSWDRRWWHYLQNIEKQIREAEIIVTDAEFTKQDLVDNLGVAEDKIKVIYPGVGKLFKPREEIKKEKIILAVGSSEPRKNLGVLVGAFNEIKSRDEYQDLKLYLVSGKGWLSRRVTDKIKKSDFSKDIKILKNISARELSLLYNKTSVFVYPSWLEGFGLPPLEAQAAGVPVVASNRSSLPEVLGVGAVYFEPWRTGELVEKIRMILEDKQMAKEMIRKGLNNAKRFDWERVAGEFGQIVKNINQVK